MFYMDRFKCISKDEFDKLKSLAPNGSNWEKYRKQVFSRMDNHELDIFVLERDNEFAIELTVNYVNYNLQAETIPNVRVYLEAFRVRKDLQKQGLGQKLISFVISYLKDRGYTEFTIGVEDDNKIAKHIYFKYGFTKEIDYGEGTEFDPSSYTLYLLDLKEKH